jgi:small-conductance mechanosensitive channel
MFFLCFQLTSFSLQMAFLESETNNMFYKAHKKIDYYGNHENKIINRLHPQSNHSKYDVEKLSIQFDLQELSRIKDDSKKFFEEDTIQKIKEFNTEIKTILEKKESTNEYLNYLYEKSEEFLKQIIINQNYLDQFIKEYEKIVYQFLNNKNTEQSTSKTESFLYKKINQQCIKISKLYKELLFLDKKTNSIKKEEAAFKDSFKKSNVIFTSQSNINKNNPEIQTEENNITSESKKNINYLEENNIFLEAHLEKISIFNYKLQQKILNTRKKYIKEEIKDIKNYFSNKYNSDMDKIYFQKEKDLLAANQKKLSIKKHELIEQLEKNNQLKNPAYYFYDKDLKQKTLQIIENLKTQPINQSINDVLNIFELIKTDMLNITLNIINGKIYANKKNLDLMEGWYIYWQPEIHNNAINNAMKNCNPIIIKNNNNDLKIQLEGFSEKILTYIHFLNAFVQTEDLDIHLKNYRATAKFYLDALTEKNNKIFILINNIKNLFYIASILQEELKIKTFWARSEYSISFLKLKNFIPEIKLFIFELKENFFSFINLSIKKISNFYQVSLLHILLYALYLFFIIGSAYLYKRIFKKLATFIDNIEQQSYYMRKINFLVAILSHKNILFYIWLNLFICVYNKIISLYYLDALFFLFSIPIAIYLINSLLNDFLPSISDTNIKQNFFSYSNNNFFYKKLLLDTIIFLFFIRQALMSLIIGNAHEIILAAQFILIQIQLIILLKKNYIIQYVTEIKLFNDYSKDFISQYYQLFIALLVTLIVMSNPYVGYGYQMLYILSRSILTLITLPLFNLIFDFIKKKSLYVFFNFEDGEARNKIKMGNMIYIGFLSICYFIIFIFTIFIILKLWGYSIQLKSIFNLIYVNLLPSQEILSNEAITSLSINTLFIVFFYIAMGYFFSYCINSFVFAKILNPIVIGQTMQNTIMTIFKYIIVCSCFIIGLCTAGLQSIITKLGALIIALSFALKEPVADFISYFIILIQCPIKVGDVIKINKEGGGSDIEVTGIVRSINSRTTIIRQKNSQSVIVPNSIILKRSICNWTYHKSGFTAIEDFFIIIDRKHDAELVKNLLIKIVESCPGILKTPIPLVRCENISPIGYDFLIRGYINIERASDQWDLASQLRITIAKKLDIEKIYFAIPEYKINMQKYTDNINI